MTPPSEIPPKRKVGRPRKNPLPDPNLPKRKPGNPNLTKGVNNPRGANDPEGALIAPVRQLRIYVPRCAEFMTNEGWALLEEAARCKFSKSQIPALKLIAAYGIGNPAETMDLTSGGKAITDIASFLAGRNNGAEGSTSD